MQKGGWTALLQLPKRCAHPQARIIFTCMHSSNSPTHNQTHTHPHIPLALPFAFFLRCLPLPLSLPSFVTFDVSLFVSLPGIALILPSVQANVGVLMDAEQSYFQVGTRSFPAPLRHSLNGSSPLPVCHRRARRPCSAETQHPPRNRLQHLPVLSGVHVPTSYARH
jgi:hypothetical protein